MTNQLPAQPTTTTNASVNQAPPRVFHANYFKLWAGLHFFMLNMSIFNLLPYYLELRGASADFYGSVAGSMGISNVFLLLMFGRFADRWSRKATVSLYFVASFAGNLVALWAMHQPDLNWYFLSRVLHGMYMGLGFPIVFSWVVELSHPSKKHVALAWYGIAGIFANSLGPSLGEAILTFQSASPKALHYQPVFWLSTLFQIVSFFCYLTVKNFKPAALNPQTAKKGFLYIARFPNAWLLLVVSFSFGGMFGVLMSFGKNYTASLGLQYVSVLLWAYTIGAIFSRICIQQVGRLFGEQRLAAASMFGIGVSFVCLVIMPSYAGLGIAGAIYGLCHGILYPTLFVRFLNLVQDSEMGRAATLFQGSFTAGWGSFPLIGGTMIRLGGFRAIFMLYASLAVCCGMLLATYQHKISNKPLN